MKYKDIMKLSHEELKRLPEQELREALEDYAKKEHIITFDDSGTQLS